MEGTEILSRQEKLVEVKRKIKAWEGDYRSTHGCAPDKAALCAAPEEIRAAYKAYRHYRKALESLPLNTDDDNKRVDRNHSQIDKSHSPVDKISSQVDENNSQDDKVHSQVGKDHSQVDMISSQVDENTLPLNKDLSQVRTRDSQSSVGSLETVDVNTSECVPLPKDSSCVSTCEESPAPVNALATNNEAANDVPVLGANDNKTKKQPNDSERSTDSEGTSDLSNPESADTANNPPSNSTNVWGSHLNKINMQAKLKDTSKQNSLYTKMAEKLRAGSTIKVRTSLKRPTNPRKFKPNAAHISKTDPTIGDSPSDIDNSQNSAAKNNEVTTSSQEHSAEESGETDRPFEGTIPSEGILPFETNNTQLPVPHESSSGEPKSLSIFDSLDQSPVSLSLKFTANQSMSKQLTPHSVNPASPFALANTKTEARSIKQRVSLNPGWLARCTGASLPESTKLAPPSDDWKMKLTDREWVEEESDNEAETVGISNAQDSDNDIHPTEIAPTQLPPVTKTRRKVNPQRKTNKIDLQDKINKLEDAPGEEQAPKLPAQAKITKRKLNSKRRANILDSPDKIDNAECALDEDQDCDSPPPPLKTTKRKLNPRKRANTIVSPANEEQEASPDEEQSYESPPPACTTAKRKRVPQRKANEKSIPDKTEEQEAAPNDDDDDTVPESASPVRQRLRTRRNPVPTTDTEPSDITDAYDFDEDISNDEDGDWNESEETNMKSCKFRLREETDSEEYCDDEDVDEDELDDNTRSRKQNEVTLEELEESGKIQSVWPPPKKKRIARKKANRKFTAITVKRVKQNLDLEASAKTPTRAARKRGRPKQNPDAPLKIPSRAPRKKITPNPETIAPKQNPDAPLKIPSRAPRKKMTPNSETIAKIPARAVQKKATQDSEAAPVKIQRKRVPAVKPKQPPNLDNENSAKEKQPPDPNEEYDETDDIENNGRKTVARKGKWLSGQERIENKASTGSLNNNYVRINLKKKVFVRGKKGMTGAKYKRQEWKKKQFMKGAEQGNAGAIKSLTCFKCGDFGHWSRNCPGKIGDNLMPLQEYDAKESTFLSLDEAASMAIGIKPTSQSVQAPTRVYSVGSQPEDIQIPALGNIASVSKTDYVETPTNVYPSSSQSEDIQDPALNEQTDLPTLQSISESTELQEHKSTNDELSTNTQSSVNSQLNTAATQDMESNTQSTIHDNQIESSITQDMEVDKQSVMDHDNQVNLSEVQDMKMGTQSTDHDEQKQSSPMQDMELCTRSTPQNNQINSSQTQEIEVEKQSTDQNSEVNVTETQENEDHLDADDDLFANMDMDNLEEQSVDNESASQETANYSDSQAEPSRTPRGYNERPTVDCLYSLEDGKLAPTPNEVYEVLEMFGYSSFRPGQEEAIMRVLSGQSTLLVLSTGSGKSLCYQLPAFLFARHRSPCITLCVSPLVSLMEDQVTGLPDFLHAVCLHTHQNPTQRSRALRAIESGSAHILLVSPEAVVASRSGGVLGTLLKQLPPVAFACLDEAHCVSEWSHNFRPSYLRVCQVLRERLGVRTILGLTATARHVTGQSIAQHLLVPDFDTGIIRGTSVPDNLHLSVSRDEHREQALVGLLQGERFAECNSIIVYCTRRDECERVSTLIRTKLLNPSKVDVKSNLKKNRGLSFDAEAYHAGLSSYRRHQVQKRFMSGKLRIVVATVAFGMGIDKSDVRGIIHFNMPRNVESYVQEIGRAGRDGKDAHCHLFLDAQDGRDIQELKRHIYANSIDRHTVRKLLNKIFKPCTCAKIKKLEAGGDGVENENSLEGNSGVANNEPTESMLCDEVSEDATTNSSSLDDPFTVSTRPSSCPKHEVAIPIEHAVEELDIPEPNLETLLCYLDLHQGSLIHLSTNVYANCNVSCYAGPRQLVAVSRRCPPLAIAVALERQKGVNFDNSNKISFPVVEVASRMGWNSKIVKSELKSLEWDTQNLSIGGKVKKSGVIVEFTDLSFHLEARGDLTDDERDHVLDAMYSRCQRQEKDQLKQLSYTYHLLRQVSHNSILFCCDTVDAERCDKLRTGLREYFSKENKNLSAFHVEERIYVRPEVEAGVRSSVHAMLSTHHDQQWTGRAIARVFHGIGSPNFPAEVWGRVRRFWRGHLNADFNTIVKIATREILRYKYR